MRVILIYIQSAFRVARQERPRTRLVKSVHVVYMFARCNNNGRGRVIYRNHIINPINKSLGQVPEDKSP